VIPQWAVDLGKNPDWRLVYLDSQDAVYLRQGYQDEVPALDYGKLLTDNGASNSLLSQAPSLLGMEPPSTWNGFWASFVEPVDYPNGLLNLGISTNYAGNSQVSELFFLEAIRRTAGRFPDFYYDLGLVYAYSNRREEAVLCMRRVLRDRPGDPVARQITGLPPEN
jgi:hypothetical protein